MEDEDFGFTKRDDGILRNVSGQPDEGKDAGRDEKDSSPSTTKVRF